MNNCSDPLYLGSLPAKRLAGKISFPLPSTAARELLLPVSTPPVPQHPGARFRGLSSFPSLPFAFLWKTVLGSGDGFLSPLGLLENCYWHKSTEPPCMSLFIGAYLTYLLPVSELPYLKRKLKNNYLLNKKILTYKRIHLRPFSTRSLGLIGFQSP